MCEINVVEEVVNVGHKQDTSMDFSSQTLSRGTWLSSRRYTVNPGRALFISAVVFSVF